MAEDIYFEGPKGARKRYRYMGTESHGETVLALTSAERAFLGGYDYRAFYNVSVLTLETLVIKVVATKDSIVRLLGLEVLTNALTLELVSGGTEGGSFSTPVLTYASNQTSVCPVRPSGVTMSTGGTHTGGTVIESLSGAVTNQSNQAIVEDEQPLGFSAGTFYLRFVNSGNQTATATFRARWEEL